MFSLNLHQKEEIKQLYRQTSLVLFKPLLWCAVLIYFPCYFLFKYELLGQFKTLLYTWILIILCCALFKIILWALNTYLITNQRLVVVIYKNLFSKQVIETPIERILNISFNKHGFFPSVLNFGDVVVQVVGLTQPITLKKVRQPENTKDYLWQIHTELMPKHEKAFDRENIEKIQQQLGYGKGVDK